MSQQWDIKPRVWSLYDLVGTLHLSVTFRNFPGSRMQYKMRSSSVDDPILAAKSGPDRFLKALDLEIEGFFVLTGDLDEVPDYRSPRHQARSNQVGAGDSRTTPTVPRI